MGSHISFVYSKHKLWPKEGSKVKLPIWFPIIKNQESPWFTYVQVLCHISLKSSQQGLQLYFRPYFNRRSLQKVIGFQSRESFNFGNFGTPKLGVPRQNDIWVQALWLGIDNIIMGKVVASPKSGPWWVLWVCVCLWFVHAPKVF
jgi:hypothetical protein